MRRFFWKLKIALFHAWVVFRSYYGKLPNDKITADLYELHLKARRNNPQFQEFQSEASRALASSTRITSEWLNTYIPTIVPQEEIDNLIDDIKKECQRIK